MVSLLPFRIGKDTKHFSSLNIKIYNAPCVDRTNYSNHARLENLQSHDFQLTCSYILGHLSRVQVSQLVSVPFQLICLLKCAFGALFPHTFK